MVTAPPPPNTGLEDKDDGDGGDGGDGGTLVKSSLNADVLFWTAAEEFNLFACEVCLLPSVRPMSAACAYDS